MRFEVPPLPYSKDALTPHMSAETFEYHYEKHHKAYVAKLASLLEGGNPSPIDPYVTIDGRRARLNIMVEDIGAAQMQVLIEAIDGEIGRRFDGFDDLEVILTGNASG